ncbi:hypothetical protein D3C80_1479360 [compost metagenome]
MHNAAFINNAASHLRFRRHILRRLIRVAGEYTPVRIIQVQRRMVAQQVHISFPQAGDRTDISPVAFKRICVQGITVFKHQRNDIFAEVMRGACLLAVLQQMLAQNVPFENIYTHGSQCALRLGGLFIKFINFQVFIRIKDTKAACFLQRNINDRDGAVGVSCFVVLQHSVVVHFVNMIPGQDKHMLRIKLVYKFEIAVNRISRSPVPVASVLPFMRRQHEHSAIFTVQIPVTAYSDV